MGDLNSFPGTKNSRETPWVADGALLCNFTATTFKLYFPGLRSAKYPYFAPSHAGLPCPGSLFNPVEERGRKKYGHRITFQRIAGLGILQAAEKRGAQE